MSVAERHVCTGGVPPECCQPPTTVEHVIWHGRGVRLQAAQERAEASVPTCCPSCGADSDLTPTFDGPGDFWACGACGDVFEVGR